MNKPLTIIDEVSVNRQIFRLQRLQRFSAHLLAAASRMESVEKWTFDDLILDSAGEAIGVNDERGTGEERLIVLRKFQSGMNSEQLSKYIQSGIYDDEIDRPIIEILSVMKTRRFLLGCYYIDSKNKKYMSHLLNKILKEDATDIASHILRSRLDRLNRLNVVQSIFSDESVAQVKAVLAAMKDKA